MEVVYVKIHKGGKLLHLQLHSYQVLLVLPPQSKQNQSVLAADQEVSCDRATRHGNGTLRQRDLNDLHLYSAPHRCPAQQVAQQTHPDTGSLFGLNGEQEINT